MSITTIMVPATTRVIETPWHIAYTTSDGRVFDTQEEAQKYEDCLDLYKRKSDGKAAWVGAQRASFSKLDSDMEFIKFNSQEEIELALFYVCSWMWKVEIKMDLKPGIWYAYIVLYGDDETITFYESAPLLADIKSVVSILEK